MKTISFLELFVLLIVGESESYAIPLRKKWVGLDFRYANFYWVRFQIHQTQINPVNNNNSRRECSIKKFYSLYKTVSTPSFLLSEQFKLGLNNQTNIRFAEITRQTKFTVLKIYVVIENPLFFTHWSENHLYICKCDTSETNMIEMSFL